MFSSTYSLNEIENLQKQALRFLHDDFEASYEDLLSKGGKSKMGDWGLYVSKFTKHLMILIQVLWVTFSN